MRELLFFIIIGVLMILISCKETTHIYPNDMEPQYNGNQEFCFLSGETDSIIVLKNNIEKIKTHVRNHYEGYKYHINFSNEDFGKVSLYQGCGNINIFGYYQKNNEVFYTADKIECLTINGLSCYVYVMNAEIVRCSSDNFLYPQKIYYSCEYGILKISYSGESNYILINKPW